MGVSERHRRERQARRAVIMDAALKVFADHGLDGATIEMVAREAEVAVGTIYLYFTSRDDLFLSLITERAEKLRARYLEIKAQGLSARDELSAITAAYLDHLRESRGLFLAQLSVAYPQIYRRLRRKGERDRYRRAMELSREIFALWEDSVARVQRPGGAGKLFHARAAAAMWAALNGAFLLTDHSALLLDVTGLRDQDFIGAVFNFMLAAVDAATLRAARSAPNGAARDGGSDHLNGNGTAPGRAARNRNGNQSHPREASASRV